MRSNEQKMNGVLAQEGCRGDRGVLTLRRGDCNQALCPKTQAESAPSTFPCSTNTLWVAATSHCTILQLFHSLLHKAAPHCSQSGTRCWSNPFLFSQWLPLPCVTYPVYSLVPGPSYLSPTYLGPFLRMVSQLRMSLVPPPHLQANPMSFRWKQEISLLEGHLS